MPPCQNVSNAPLPILGSGRASSAKNTSTYRRTSPSSGTSLNRRDKGYDIHGLGGEAAVQFDDASWNRFGEPKPIYRELSAKKRPAVRGPLAVQSYSNPSLLG